METCLASWPRELAASRLLRLVVALGRCVNMSVVLRAFGDVLPWLIAAGGGWGEEVRAVVKLPSG